MTSLWSRVCLGVGFMLLTCSVQLHGAEVVDFSHLVDGDADVGSESRTVRDVPSVRDDSDVDSLLVAKVAELEELVERRDRQIDELKYALEEVTTEFSKRMTRMQLTRERDEEQEARTVIGLRESLSAKAAALQALEEERDALGLAKRRALSELDRRRREEISALEKQHSDRLTHLLSEHERALKAQQEKHAAEVEGLLARHAILARKLDSEHARKLASMESAHAANVRALERAHAEQVAAMKAAQDKLASIEAAQDQDASLAAAHAEQIASLTSGHAEQIASLKAAHAEAVASVQAMHTEQVTALEAAHAAKVSALETAHAETVSSLEVVRSQMAALETTHAETIRALESEHQEKVAAMRTEHVDRIASLQNAYDTLRDDTKSDREDARRLQAKVSDLEAGLMLAERQNERERFLLAYNSGSLFLAAGRYDRAERELLKALSIREDDAPLHYNLGVLYDQHLPQPAKARHHYERFLELAPNDRDAPAVMRWLRELR